MSMSAADTCVNEIIKNIRQTFTGLEDEAVQEFHKIMSTHIRTFGELMLTQGTPVPVVKMPKLKRFSNYTMFGNHFREVNNGKIPSKDMFNAISVAWNKLTPAEQDEWKVKSAAQNEILRQEYIKQNGSLPQKGKLKVRKGAKTTSAFQQYLVDFRKENKDNKEIKHTDVFSKASEKWKKMTPKQKKKYEDRASVLKEQYKVEWEQYKLANPQPVVETKATDGKKQKKEARGPIPALQTGYRLYGIYWRENHNPEKLTGKLAMTAIGSAWKALEKKEQEKYNSKSATMNVTATQEFVKTNPEAKWTQSYNLKQSKKTAAV
jgi:HMG-box domain